ncbi:integral membrane sensor signal transduction histidine kinase [Paludibacter propionicigenes WB4]|uniref:histidine kinase n=1 Tax=Paludibacter propionicigenes (strain DSM 17365 / JCM 13257 / WB4) TaxID=694427 RepID=E4T0I8_PALPW|nr:ATP-binding protein [Paludibacter propionicigenes]ADQ78347.1 integral membrane sensor signal transduction histidine kinase [Paludibacter propionicigenes WB4]
MSFTQKKSTNSYLVIALIVSITFGFVCDFFYQQSPKRSINLKNFQKEVIRKEKVADKTLEDMKKIITHGSSDSLIHYPFGDEDIAYYVFKKGGLAFWSDNRYDISSTSMPELNSWRYTQLPNAYCITKVKDIGNWKLMALITIKNNYPYENHELTNSFAKGFRIDKQVQIVAGNITDKNAVFSSHDNYLFTLTAPKTPVYNERWALAGLLAFTLAFILFFTIYVRAPYLINRRILSLREFSILAVGVGAFIGACLYFNFPSLVFWNKIFTPYQYASNSILASISHLTVVTGYFISTIYLFYFHAYTNSIKHRAGHFILQIIFVLYFVLVYNILSGLIHHSSIQISILSFKDFSGVTLWVHFLILVWGIGLVLLFLKSHNWFKTKHLLNQALIVDAALSLLLFVVYATVAPESAIRITVSFSIICGVLYFPYIFKKYKNNNVYIACWVFVFTAFLVCNSFIIDSQKRNDKYKVLAQNILVNGNTENDKMADILLEELDYKISTDRRIGLLVSKKDSLTAANEYLNKKYLRGFWNKYEMRINATYAHSALYNDYEQFILTSGTKLKNTHFYSVPANESNMSYIGKFQANYNRPDSMFFFMEFYPRRNFKSYSFPNLLIASTPDIQARLNIGIAKYDRERLVYSSGKFEFPQENKWLHKKQSGFFHQEYKGYTHYIYSPSDKNYIVISELQPHHVTDYLLYFIYTFLAFFSACWLFVWAFFYLRRNSGYRLGLTAKFQYAFITLLIISFLGIFYVSVNYIEQKYQQEQIDNLENKKNYIQKALQDIYYWNQDLNVLNTQALNFTLQDLSYIYHTDIHVYDNRGILMGSSQPLIFNKNLISNKIAPLPYFSTTSNINQYEHIGKLNYLTGYIDFVNGDFTQIGYIAVPQFFSQDEIRSEIESFLTVIIHIYMIIIVLAIVLSLFIGKQLSAPLIVLEMKLKDMRLGRRNEKIDYNLNDEIGQLVQQYNRTVDELEQSARLLAKSERESAWRSMARQVAHEINNPLTPMKLTIQQLQRTKKMQDKQFDDYFEKSSVMLIEQIDNLSRIAGTFSNFARMPEASFVRVDVAAKIYSVFRLFMNNNEHVTMHYEGAEQNVFVYADPEQLVQVFNNLIKNALQAIPEEREGEISIRLTEEAKEVTITVSDNGAGIVAEIQDKLFIPNFTTKSTGMGLGLAIAKNIIEISGGSITFSTAIDEGTTFTVRLPKSE